MKKIIWTLVSLTLLLGTCVGYFENKYYCSLQENNIIVALKKTETAKKCMIYISEINQNIATFEKNIGKANYYINKQEDEQYWEQVKAELETNKKKNELVKQQILTAMQDFEKKLFGKVKKLLSYYLLKEKKTVQDKLEDLSENMAKAREQWDMSMFAQYRDEAEMLEIERWLLNSILYAGDFAQMAPFLKHWIEFYYNKR